MKKDIKMKEKQKKNIIKNYVVLLIFVAITLLILFLLLPDKRDSVMESASSYLVEMVYVLPAVLILMGLFKVWVPNELIIKYLGKTSGVKGILLALLMGSFPTGPLYIAFPIAAQLVNKGARISNIVIFLSAWACIKIPQELLELQFLGLEFMALRLTLTIIFAIIIGYAIEKIIEFSNSKKSVEVENS